MTGVILASHGNFAREVMASIEMVSGKMKRTKAYSLNPGDDPQVLSDDMLAGIHELDDGDGVLVLVDMMGGTPYNRAMSLMNNMNLNIRVVAGMNMAMLLVINLERTDETPLSILVEMATQGGKDGIRSFVATTPVAPASVSDDGCEED